MPSRTDYGFTLCRVARKTERGKTRGDGRGEGEAFWSHSDNWSTANGRVTSYNSQPFSVVTMAPSLRSASPFLRSGRIDLFWHFEISVRGDQRGEGCAYFRSGRIPAVMGNLADFFRDSTTSFAESGSEQKIAKIRISRGAYRRFGKDQSSHVYKKCDSSNVSRFHVNRSSNY